VSILTGRLYSGTRAIAKALGVVGPVGCVDGSHVVDASTHATVFHQGIRGERALALRTGMVEAGPATFLFARDAVVHDDAGERYLSYVRTWSTDLRRAERVGDHELWETEEGVTAVVAVGTSLQIGRAVEAIQRKLAGVAQVTTFPLRASSDLRGMVVRAAGVTKGTALAWLADHYGIPLEATVCVGDWINDIAMFQVAGRSFAMGQSPTEVKRAATDHLEETNVAGGGIARVVEHVFGVALKFEASSRCGSLARRP
jgi:hydroxymethylpyrimidine pyrophosphatase-like HAD family hydrolase